MPYGERAQDRAEVFEPGSLSWPGMRAELCEGNMNASKIQFSIMKVLPVVVEATLVRIDAVIPSTAVAGLRLRLQRFAAGLLKGSQC